ncbi:GNAT family N-acetyltransferase [Cohnella panacarvi]|uniref:GNAT family N-acetyltransferase n=1 Tax=Cohnella panacarvi TaxID=400776 RepID=UPI00047E03A7|nr:GNAT family N-acetyltransferase [Cohnella panacarvi]
MITLDKLDDRYWPGALGLYRQAFPEGKPESILISMFRKRIAYLHVTCDERGVAAMAITGQVAQGKLLLIDYLAVREDSRGQGIGQALLGEIKNWAAGELSADGLLIEVEYGKTPEDVSRLRFWQRCGFVLTEYVHKYIWVPEPYQAMYFPLAPDPDIPSDGRKLFKYISDYHGKSFRGES